MFFRQMMDDKLAQYAYLVGCQKTGEALLIDPERDIDRYIDVAGENDLQIVAVTETHIHADFLSGCREFAERRGVRVYLSDEGGADWKYQWARECDAKLLRHGDVFNVGNIDFKAVHTPGHTPEHLSFMITDRGGGADQPMGIASGDFVFVNDLGRPDLLESAAGHVGAMRPSAERLYRSALQFLDYPDYLQVWPGHGAGSACGKALGAVPETTVGYERRFSPALKATQEGESHFIDFILSGQPEPPLYFARMKTLNRMGPPVLGSLPTPRPFSSVEVAKIVADRAVTILDTRPDRDNFFRGHLPGSLLSSHNKTFPTIVGSYADPEKEILLVGNEETVDQIVRDLVRIGYDHVLGYVSLDVFEQYQRDGGRMDTIESIDMAEFERRVADHRHTILDVRRQTEFAERKIVGAQNIAHTRLAARVNEVSRDKPILVHCRTGERASAAVSMLKRDGLDVVHVNGNFDTWRPSTGILSDHPASHGV